MQVNIDQNTQAIVKKLIEEGTFTSIDSAVNAMVQSAFISHQFSSRSEGRLPDPILAVDEYDVFCDLPRGEEEAILELPVDSSKRNPEFLGVE